MIGNLGWCQAGARFTNGFSIAIQIGNCVYAHIDYNALIATKFCTWGDNYDVMAYTEICCDTVANNWITTRRIFHRNCIASKRSLVKWARDQRKLLLKMISNHNRIHNRMDVAGYPCPLSKLISYLMKEVPRLQHTVYWIALCRTVRVIRPYWFR